MNQYFLTSVAIGILTIALSASFAFYFSRKKKKTIQMKWMEETSSSEIVLKLCKEFTEMNWLTENVHASPEGITNPNDQTNFSQQLFGKSHPEFDRTAVGALCLLWVIKGDYAKFSECQKEGVKITPKSFQKLQKYTNSIVSSDEKLIILLTFTIINDLGKIKVIDEKFGGKFIDHDQVLCHALQTSPQSFPSFIGLEKRYQKMILDGLRTNFNFGQFLQAENLPENLEGLKQLDKETLDLFILHAVYDMAGAAGHIKNNGSLVMTEVTYQDFDAAIESIQKLKENNSNVVEVYDSYLEIRGKSLSLSPRNPSERAQIRICCMLRYHTPEEAKNVREVTKKFAEWNELVKELNYTGKEQVATLIYYAPAFLLNLQSSFGKGTFSSEALDLALQTLMKIFQLVRNVIDPKVKTGVFSVDISDLANKAKNPEDFRKVQISLESEGLNGKIKC